MNTKIKLDLLKKTLIKHENAILQRTSYKIWPISWCQLKVKGAIFSFVVKGLNIIYFQLFCSPKSLYFGSIHKRNNIKSKTNVVA